MTNQEILEKAITKAIEGGWADGKPALEQLNNTADFAIPVYATQFIYSQDFAKALWGEAECKTTYVGTRGEGYSLMPEWMERLQQMVIAEDPIKYLGDNI